MHLLIYKLKHDELTYIKMIFYLFFETFSVHHEQVSINIVLKLLRMHIPKNLF